MDPSLRTSAAGMQAQQRRVDVIANNLANVNTVGFKRSRANFEDVLYETLQGQRVVNLNNAETLAPVQIGKGVRLATIQRIHSQGNLENTGRQFDIAIEGPGMFQVLREDGSLAYTRAGNLSLSDSGTLVTHAGHTIVPGITVPPEADGIGIAANGVVTALMSRSGESVEVGRIELARFLNPEGLMSLGENLLLPTAASGDPIIGFPQEDGFGRVLQGTLEMSNVEIVQEMVDMISAQRAYEVNSKAIRVSEEMVQQGSNDLIR